MDPLVFVLPAIGVLAVVAAIGWLLHRRRTKPVELLPGHMNVGALQSTPQGADRTVIDWLQTIGAAVRGAGSKAGAAARTAIIEMLGSNRHGVADARSTVEAVQLKMLHELAERSSIQEALPDFGQALVRFGFDEGQLPPAMKAEASAAPATAPVPTT